MLKERGKQMKDLIGLIILLGNGFVQFLIALFIISLFIPFEFIVNIIHFIIAIGLIVGLVILFVNTLLRW